MNAGTPVDLAMREKDLPNLLSDGSIFSFAPTGRALAPCILATFRDGQALGTWAERETPAYAVRYIAISCGFP